MSAVAPTPPPGPVQGPARGAGDPAATAIITQMLQLAQHFISMDADPQDKQAMGEIAQHLALLSQAEATESAPAQHGGAQGLGGAFAGALANRGMPGGLMGGGQ